jgi:hypothetical protein
MPIGVSQYQIGQLPGDQALLVLQRGGRVVADQIKYLRDPHSTLPLILPERMHAKCLVGSYASCSAPGAYRRRSRGTRRHHASGLGGVFLMEPDRDDILPCPVVPFNQKAGIGRNRCRDGQAKASGEGADKCLIAGGVRKPGIIDFENVR